jgi:hypothetical protein
MLLPADTPIVSLFLFWKGSVITMIVVKNMFRMFSFLACPDWVLLNFFPFFYAMIVYDLTCSCGYQFEGWFQSRNDYEKQLQEEKLNCPLCDSGDVRKILSPVAGRKLSSHAIAPELQQVGVVAGENDSLAAAGEILEKLQQYVEKNFEDVGAQLTEETLKMHYGVSELRNVRGVASEEQEKILKQEGIELLKIPMIVRKEAKKLN